MAREAEKATADKTVRTRRRMRPTPVRIKEQENPVLEDVSNNSDSHCIFVQPRRLHWTVVNQKCRDTFWRHVQLGPEPLPLILFNHV